MQFKFILKEIFRQANLDTPSRRRGLGYSDAGFVAFFLVILTLSIMTGLALSIALVTFYQQRISLNILKSNQAYYLAEAGIEDALLRLAKGMNWSSPYTLNLGDGSATITISDIIGGSRTITSNGDVLDMIRKISAVYEITTEELSFFYGAQIGEGGLVMDDGSTVQGNVFSNGNIVAGPNTEITGSAKVAQTGNYINGATIGEDVWVDICQDSNIGDVLTCANYTNCTAFSIETLTEEIATKDFSITQAKIDQWKTDAQAGGIYSGDYILSGTNEGYLGPIKIEGFLTIQDQAELYITGTIWVTGEINIQDKSRVKLDNSYGSLSGVIISDNKITLQNDAKALGSGEEGSYLIILSTLAANPAIEIKDSFEADILFGKNGWILIQNTADVREVSGYGIHLKNNAKIIYEVGLGDTDFSTGPAGGWQVTSWREIE